MKKNYIIIGCLIFLIIILGIFRFIPVSSLKGKSIVTINVFDSYVEPGVTTNYQEVFSVQNINTKKVGVYYVTYLFKNKHHEVRKRRIVKVVDNEPPQITFTGDKDLHSCLKQYKGNDFKAYDNYDGDLTSKVKLTKDSKSITYEVFDSSSNKTTIKRNLIYEDKEGPKLILKKGSSLSINKGKKFIDPLYEVSDNCDDDSSLKVNISGNVNENVVGNYKLTYTSTDSSNNKTTVIRNVSVVDNYCYQSKENKCLIYLTFDDGPSYYNTNKLLDVLKENGVKATFFITDKNNTDSIIKRMFNEGHTIGLHTASHVYKKIYSSVDNYFIDLNQIQAKVKRITGQESKIIRFPGGSSNTISKSYSKGIMTKLTSLVLEQGYHYFDWNISSEDASGSLNAMQTYSNVISHLSKQRSNVILMHDIYKSSVDSIADIIKYGQENGYTFEKITYETPMVTHYVNN